MTPGPGRPARLVLVGSVVVDVMTSVPHLPERGGDVLATRATLQAGGGFNVLAAAARFGLPAALAGHVGSGPFGEVVARALAREGVATLLPRAAGDTGFCVGFVEPDAERTFVTSPGVESEVVDGDLARAGLRPDDAVYVSGYDLCYPVTGPVVARWCAGHHPGLLVVDPGPLVADIPAEVLRPVLARVDVLTLNAREDLLLRRRGLSPGPGAAVVRRDGARGCRLRLPGATPEEVPAPRVTAVDTTGAGDAHTGVLVAELHRTGSLPSAARTATAAAALAVTRPGSATAPTPEELAAWDRRPAAAPGA
ncbi:MAG: PfkB family carbohydrate kinase [Kineosporiaceae bacterium]